MRLNVVQKRICKNASECLKENHIAYLAMEMRTGKTLTSLSIAERLSKRSVLFITKSKAKVSVRSDYNKLKPSYELKIINDSFQSIEKELERKNDYDLIIIDEAHGYGAFPKPSARSVAGRELIEKTDLLLLSGTPSPESSGSQLFFQFGMSEYSPFENYVKDSYTRAFYRWSKNYVHVTKKYINGIRLIDYSKAYMDRIEEKLSKYFFVCTQEEAGLTAEITEKIHYCETPSGIEFLIKQLRSKKMYSFKQHSDEEVICDTAVKEMQKIHQVSSGTVISESGKHIVLSTFKADYIKAKFAGRKIAIFYIYQSEGELLRSYFTNWTEDPEDFRDSTDKVFICQIVKGSMGIDLSSADELIFFNIHFSSVQYWQARARLSNYKRTTPASVNWIFSDKGIERRIYKAVMNKKDYTIYFYRKEKF